jgi:hypothetical protein
MTLPHSRPTHAEAFVDDVEMEHHAAVDLSR